MRAFQDPTKDHTCQPHCAGRNRSHEHSVRSVAVRSHDGAVKTTQSVLKSKGWEAPLLQMTRHPAGNWQSEAGPKGQRLRNTAFAKAASFPLSPKFQERAASGRSTETRQVLPCTSKGQNE